MTAAAHSVLMDSIYRRQRHIYDFTRKYYLFGRDRLIRELDLKPGESLVEIGCGTARNLIKMAQRYPGATLYGLDASAEMLKSAQAAIARAGLADRIRLMQGLAENLNPATFGLQHPFDHAVFSYSLSMIPDWKQALRAAAGSLIPGGHLHIVDFGDLSGLGTLCRKALMVWLAVFHVAPRLEIFSAISDKEIAGKSHFSILFAHYAFLWRGPRDSFMGKLQ
jgi:S-adenosylmethionine-diacylgycerolhomoserine-N-methlytransferase